MLCSKCSPTILLFVLLLLGSPSLAQDVLVTGTPASRSYLRDLLAARGWTQLPTTDLSPGQSWSDSQGRRVINVDWTPPTASVAALSDHPEDIDRLGLLFSGGLISQRPVRFQYYHLGSLKGADPKLVLLVTNPGDHKASFHLIEAVGKPSRDYFSTGHGNNVAWFARQKNQEGVFIDVAPGETRAVFSQPLPIEHVVSGTLGLTQTQGPPLQFSFLAVPDNATPLSLNNLLKESDVHSRGFYPVATQTLRRAHKVGKGSETRIAVGALRQDTFSGVRELRGDYGVVYDVEISLVNPTPHPTSVGLWFNPRGGAATATLFWDGETLEIPRTEAMKETEIRQILLAPGQKKTVRLQTIPEGASSYPVRLVVRDRPK